MPGAHDRADHARTRRQRSRSDQAAKIDGDLAVLRPRAEAYSASLRGPDTSFEARVADLLRASAWRIHLRSVSALIPSRPAAALIAAHSES